MKCPIDPRRTECHLFRCFPLFEKRILLFRSVEIAILTYTHVQAIFKKFYIHTCHYPKYQSFLAFFFIDMCSFLFVFAPPVRILVVMWCLFSSSAEEDNER